MSYEQDHPAKQEERASGRRRIRSFVLREGRLTPGQQRALEVQWPKFGLNITAEPLDVAAAFGRVAPLVFEIGCGNGEALVHAAKLNPDHDFIGVEVHRPGVGHLLHRVAEEGLTNVRVYCADAIEVLQKAIPDNSLAKLCIFFPDPWHKKRHHKRRLVQPDFLRMIAPKLAEEGLLHIATDWAPYAEHSLEALAEVTDQYANSEVVGSATYPYVPRPEGRLLTKFEQRGLRLGHEVFDLMYRRLPDA